MLKRFKQMREKFRRQKLLSKLPNEFTNDTLLPIEFISSMYLSEDILNTNNIISVGPYNVSKDTYLVIIRPYNQKGDM